MIRLNIVLENYSTEQVLILNEIFIDLKQRENTRLCLCFNNNNNELVFFSRQINKRAALVVFSNHRINKLNIYFCF